MDDFLTQWCVTDNKRIAWAVNMLLLSDHSSSFSSQLIALCLPISTVDFSNLLNLNFPHNCFHVLLGVYKYLQHIGHLSALVYHRHSFQVTFGLCEAYTNLSSLYCFYDNSKPWIGESKKSRLDIEGLIQMTAYQKVIYCDDIIY